ncbi:MAG: ferritin family protein [Gemmataceae bacterium]
MIGLRWGVQCADFKSLSEQEILALAISLEEKDTRIYDDFAEGLKATNPQAAEHFFRSHAARKTAIAIGCRAVAPELASASP